MIKVVCTCGAALESRVVAWEYTPKPELRVEPCQACSAQPEVERLKVELAERDKQLDDEETTSAELEKERDAARDRADSFDGLVESLQAMLEDYRKDRLEDAGSIIDWVKGALKDAT